MSGAEPLIIGAALGAGVGAGGAALTGQDPLKGALLGGVTGGFTGGLGSVGSAAQTGASAAGAAGIEAGTSGALGAAMEAGALGTGANQALFSAAGMDALGRELGVSTSGGDFLTGLRLLGKDPNMTLSAMGQSAQGIGTATNAQRMLMASQMMGAGGMGGGTQTQVRPPQAPGLKPAQAPQVSQAMSGLLDERARMPQRRRMSLL
jgi:type IV secretion system protein TrbL